MSLKLQDKQNNTLFALIQLNSNLISLKCTNRYVVVSVALF